MKDLHPESTHVHPFPPKCTQRDSNPAYNVRAVLGTPEGEDPVLKAQRKGPWNPTDAPPPASFLSIRCSAPLPSPPLGSASFYLIHASLSVQGFHPQVGKMVSAYLV